MIKPKLNETKLIIGPCRLSYTHVFEKFDPSGENKEAGKYMTNILIPKSEKETIKAIETAIENAIAAGVASPKVFKGSRPRKIDSPLRDGSEKNNAGEEYDGMYYMNAKSSTRPGIVDRDNSPITDPEDIYSGVWCYVSITFFPYNKVGNCGVGVALNNLKKYKDDDRFGGGHASAESDFQGIGDTDDDDDM